MSGETSGSRSKAWFDAEGRNGFIHRSWFRGQGILDYAFDGRPVIGIANTFSELAPCNAHLRELAAAVKRGVLVAGGFPFEFPVMSLGETVVRPTAMFYRNLLALEAEENIRANPLDGVVLLGGCDKTTPGLLMGAISADIPAIMVTGGPMLNGKFEGKDIGSGTAVWQLSEALRSGEINTHQWKAAESCMSRSPGHCMSMGTASTMACMAEALGLSLPGAAAVPAVDAHRKMIAEMSGQRIVEMVKEDLRPSRIVGKNSFDNAITVLGAISGSTNAIVHLQALAGRAEVALTLEDFEKKLMSVPVVVDLQPSGKYLMEDFYYAGGLPAVMGELREFLDLGALTVTGKTVEENIATAVVFNSEVIRSLTRPLCAAGMSTRILRGSLAPDGAVLKVSAASRELLRHSGRALVFDSIEDYWSRYEDRNLDVNPSDVIVVRGAGPKGYPGFPEVGNVPMPRKVLAAGVKDMVRVCDGRMSGTGFGTCVLHVTPEGVERGPLACVRTGDRIELDVSEGTIDWCVDDEERARRLRDWRPSGGTVISGGWSSLYVEHVLSAPEGVDFDFLRGRRPAGVPRHSH